MQRSVTMDVDSAGVATLTIDVPGRPMNVLTDGFYADLEAGIEAVRADDAVVGAVVTSAKRDFLAGADLHLLAGMYDRHLPVKAAYEFTLRYTRILRALETSGKPFAAAVNGTALGGGLELVLACHYRVVADDERIRLGLPEVTVGLLPGAGGTQRLPRIIGIAEALPLILEGTHLDPAAARSLGLVDDVVAADALIEAARRWVLAQQLPVSQPWDVKGYRLDGAGSADPRSGSVFAPAIAASRARTGERYPAPRAILSCVYEGTRVPMDAALAVEASYFTTLLRDPVSRNMMRTLFLNRGALAKVPGRPRDVERAELAHIGIVGEGPAAADLARQAARAGIGVSVAGAAATNADSRVGRVDDVAELAAAELIIESFDAGSSLSQYRDSVSCPVVGLLATPALPDGHFRNDVVLHPADVVAKSPVVEVVAGQDCDRAVLAVVLDLLTRLRKLPLIVADRAGYFLGRLQCALFDEAAAMLGEGIAPALIENCARQAGMERGPLALADQYGTMRLLTVVDAVGAARPEVVQRARDALARLVGNGTSEQSAAAFYQPGSDAKPWLSARSAELWPSAAEQPDAMVVERRLLYRQSLAAVQCLQESVIGSPMAADVGAVLGLGFPAWTGGPLSLIDTVGLVSFRAQCDELADAYGERFDVGAALRDRTAPFYQPQ